MGNQIYDEKTAFVSEYIFDDGDDLTPKVVATAALGFLRLDSIMIVTDDTIDHRCYFYGTMGGQFVAPSCGATVTALAGTEPDTPPREVIPDLSAKLDGLILAPGGTLYGSVTVVPSAGKSIRVYVQGGYL